jgi:hypothetical protein
MKKTFAAIILLVLLLGGIVNTVFAREASKKPVGHPSEKIFPFVAGDWMETGTGIGVKTLLFIEVNVYEIHHYMKQIPPNKSKQAVIDMDADKKFVLKMMRDVEKDKMQTALKEAFAMNGYSDAGKIGKFMAAFKGDLNEKSQITIAYDAEKKSTTITTADGGSSTVDGVDFMKGVWSIWFGKIDQPKLGDQLLSKI